MPTPTALAPAYVKIRYSGVVFPHSMTIPVYISGALPGPGSDFDITLKSGDPQPVTDAMSDLFDLIAPFFPSTTTFGLAEAHAVDDTTGEDTFLYGWNLGKTGTGSGARAAASQLLITYKSLAGTLYRQYLMETVLVPNQKTLPPYSAGSIKDLTDFVVSDDSPILSRGNSYLFAPVSAIVKYNDKLRNQQGLS